MSAAASPEQGHAEEEPRHRPHRIAPAFPPQECQERGRHEAHHHQEVEEMVDYAEPSVVDDAELHQEAEQCVRQKYAVGRYQHAWLKVRVRAAGFSGLMGEDRTGVGNSP